MIKSQVKKYIVTVKVKPYVKRFLFINFGEPVDFKHCSEDHKFFHRLLAKPSHERDSIISDIIDYYQTDIKVHISEREFYKYGWELTKTNTVDFNLHYEQSAKLFMRLMVGTYIAHGYSMRYAIELFRTTYEYEDVWAYDTIQKDFYRNGFKTKINYQDITTNISKIILNNLSKHGILTDNALKHYTSE